MSTISSAYQSLASGPVDDNCPHGRQLYDSHVHEVQDFTQHNVAERLAAAKEQCRTHGVRFTPLL